QPLDQVPSPTALGRTTAENSPGATRRRSLSAPRQVSEAPSKPLRSPRSASSPRADRRTDQPGRYPTGRQARGSGSVQNGRYLRASQERDRSPKVTVS